MIACLCNTFHRPHILPRLLQCFLNQTEKEKRLFILDSGGDFAEQGGEGWMIFHADKPYTRTDEMINYALDYSIFGKFVTIWDDDDIYFPNHLQSLGDAVGDADVVKQKYVLEYCGDRYRRVRTDGFYMCSWLYRRSALERAGGLVSPTVSDKIGDVDLYNRLKASGAKMVEAELFNYGYNWTDEVSHYSWNLQRPTFPAVTTPGNLLLAPAFDKDYYGLPIEEGIHDKPFGGRQD